MEPDDVVAVAIPWSMSTVEILEPLHERVAEPPVTYEDGEMVSEHEGLPS